MAVPTSYTEQELKAFMLAALGQVSSYLSWDADSAQLDEAVNDVALACGVDDVADETDVRKLRLLGRYYAAEAAQVAVVADYPVSADGATLNRDRVFEMISDKLGLYWAEAFPYLPDYRMASAETRYVADPYIDAPDAEAES